MTFNIQVINIKYSVRGRKRPALWGVKRIIVCGAARTIYYTLIAPLKELAFNYLIFNISTLGGLPGDKL